MIAGRNNEGLLVLSWLDTIQHKIKNSTRQQLCRMRYEEDYCISIKFDNVNYPHMKRVTYSSYSEKSSDLNLRLHTSSRYELHSLCFIE